jgi:hypothetical protein
MNGHTPVTDEKLDSVLVQYAKAPGDLWVRITRDCRNARHDLEEFMNLVEGNSPKVKSKLLALRKKYGYELKTAQADAPSKEKIFKFHG